MLMVLNRIQDSTVRSQVWRVRHCRRFHSLDKGVIRALRAQRWFTDGLAHAMWPKNLRWVVRMMCVSGSGSVCQRTSSLEMQALQEMKSVPYNNENVCLCVQTASGTVLTEVFFDWHFVQRQHAWHDRQIRRKVWVCFLFRLNHKYTNKTDMYSHTISLCTVATAANHPHLMVVF